ncbi:MAG: hypothetical protein NXI32_06770 [bacterium]|nr:hypothetical protein [bacterium]
MLRLGRQGLSCGSCCAVTLWLCMICPMPIPGSEPILSSARPAGPTIPRSGRLQQWSDTRLAANIVPADISSLASGSNPNGTKTGQEIPASFTRSAAGVVTLVDDFDPAQGPRATNSDCLVLDGRDIACRVSENWLPADVLRQRARSLVQLFSDAPPEQRQAASSLARFLCMQADHQQDIAASSGLRTYYSRIGLDEQLSLTHETLKLIDVELEKLNAAQRGGLLIGVDLSNFERRRISIQDQQLQVIAQDRQLKSLLAQLADLDYTMSETCQERLQIIPTSLDCQALQSQALYMRSDLKAWRYLGAQINEDSAPVFAQMLGTLIGNWGFPLPQVGGLKRLLCPPDHATLATNMKHEICLIIETHEHWILQAVAEKCAAVELGYQRTELARRTIDSWQARVKQLELLSSRGETAPQQLAEARTELLKARAEEISRRLEAKLAEVDLAEACGGMRDRCCHRLPWLPTGN